MGRLDMRYNRINVFFDTNKLECRFNGNRFFLEDITLNNDFREILDFASGNDNVSFFIPLIVWREILTHLIEDFNNSKQSFSDTIANFKKGFGSLLDISTTFSTENYEEYINEKAKSFLSAYKDSITLVSHSSHEEKFKSIIDNAINRKSPFSTAKGKNKTYSDAGFKDMLILETIIDNCKHDEIGILYTDDRDFKEAFLEYEKDKFFIAHTISDLKTLITAKSTQLIEKNIKKVFLKNEYLQEKICDELKMKLENTTNFEVNEVFENDDIYTIIIQITSTLKKFKVYIEYDYNANEIINVEEMESDNDD